MKRTPCLIFLSCCLLMAKGQAPVDSSTIKSLNAAARAFLFSNTDSSISYAQQAASRPVEARASGAGADAEN